MSIELPTARERSHHELVDPHRRGRWLTDVILGGQDGLVNVLGVILAVAAASQSTRLVLVAGFAAALAESISMAAVAYTSTAASGDLYRGERAREYRHIQAVPNLERAEVREIYAKKGFAGELLDRIVDKITSDANVWVSVMMAEEHGLADTNRRASLRSSFVVGASSLAGSLLPLVPFTFLPTGVGAAASIVLSAATLFAFGAYKAKVTIGNPWKGGLELATIGTVAALVGYAIGALLRLPTAG